MLESLLRSRKGTAEVVGTVLFLVILFFFFSNVFLWHNQVSQEMNQVIADKADSAVGIKTTVTTGATTSDPNCPFTAKETYNDNDTRAQLDCTPSVSTGIDSLQDWTLVSAVDLSIKASYQAFGDVCYVYVYDFTNGQWFDTGLRIADTLMWLNVTLSQATRYINYNSGGLLQIAFNDSSSVNGVPNNYLGTLTVYQVQVTVDQIALEITNLGGVDTSLSRLWIIENTSHSFVDLEADNIWVRAGSQIIIPLTDPPIPQSILDAFPAQNVTFRVLTTLGNTAACSVDFPSYEV
jgi:hypothetical protein